MKKKFLFFYLALIICTPLIELLIVNNAITSFTHEFDYYKISIFSSNIQNAIRTMMMFDIVSTILFTGCTIFILWYLKKTFNELMKMIPSYINALIVLFIVFLGFESVMSLKRLNDRVFDSNTSYRKKIIQSLRTEDFYVFKYFFYEANSMNHYEILDYMKNGNLKMKIIDYKKFLDKKDRFNYNQKCLQTRKQCLLTNWKVL